MSYRRSPSGLRSLGVGADGGVRWWAGNVENATVGSRDIFHSAGKTTVGFSPAGSPYASGTFTLLQQGDSPGLPLAGLYGRLNVVTFTKTASSLVSLSSSDGGTGVCYYLPNGKMAVLSDAEENRPPYNNNNQFTARLTMYDTSIVKTYSSTNWVIPTGLWSRKLASGGPLNDGFDTASDTGHLITGDTDHIYVWGFRQYFNTISKIAISDGTVVWQKGTGLSTGGLIKGIDVDASGNVYVISATRIAKYNSSGTFQWARSGGSSYEAITVDRGTGDVYVAAGAAVMKIATAGTLTWIRQLTGVTFTGVGVDGGGNVYGYGYTTAGFHLAKWNSSGTIQYKKAFTLNSHSGTNYVAPTNLAVSALGHVFFGMPLSPTYARTVYFGYFTSTPANGTYQMTPSGDSVIIGTSGQADTTPATTLTTQTDPFTGSTVAWNVTYDRTRAGFSTTQYVERYRSPTI